MSLLDRFRHHAAAVPQGSVDEHQAVVELLALAAFADAAVSDAEFAELAAFDTGHASWDLEGFSVLQHLPVAVARARSGQSTVADLAKRITTREVRREALAEVEKLLKVDGLTGQEPAFLSEVRAALA